MKCGIDPYADNESWQDQAQERPDHAEREAGDRDSISLQPTTTSRDSLPRSPAEDYARHPRAQKRRKDQSNQRNEAEYKRGNCAAVAAGPNRR